MRNLVRLLPVLLLHVVLVTALADAEKNYEAPEPFPYLHGHTPKGQPARPDSPDPLVQSTWSSTVNQSQLQIYRVFHPNSYSVDPPDAIDGLETLLLLHQHQSSRSPPASLSLNLQIHKPCSLQLDWGVERAAWLEFTLKDNDKDAPPHSVDSLEMRAGLSEWNRPYPGKTRKVTKYGNYTYRLETNPELYEGIRFTWLYFDNVGPETTIVVDSISLVAKIKPINYTGFYASSDPELTQAWYTGAYAVRLNMETNGFNSVLMERGDRVAIQGDGHPTMEAALVAFSPFELVANVLNQTDSADHYVVDQSIMPYPLYWCLSVLDWFMASGDYTMFQEKLAQHVMKIVDARIADFLDPDIDIVWMGWDDRLGNGWCQHSNHDDCGREAQLAFAGLVLRVCEDLTHVLYVSGMTAQAENYAKEVVILAATFVQTPEWPQGFGVHSAGNAINAHVVSSTVIEEWMDTVLNDAVTICSFSPFNQYWILQALGNAGEMEFALASIKLCWGPQLRLGSGCFWELGSPDWEAFMKEGDEAPGMFSYCHPWSSGVTAWQTHVHAGIEPLLPGYKQVVIAPYVSERYPSVSAGVTAPQGPIHVNATLHRGLRSATVQIVVDTPVSGYVGIPSDATKRKDCHIFANQSETKLDGEHAILLNSSDINGYNGFLKRQRFSGFLFVRIREPGYHVVTLKSVQCHHIYKTVKRGDVEKRGQSYSVPPFPMPDYPAQISTDSVSGGNGLARYGRDGFVLLGYDQGKDRVSLPTYVRNVTLQQHGWGIGWKDAKRIFVGESSSNPSYLPSPDVTNKTRALGMVGHDGSFGSQVDNSIVVEATLSHSWSDYYFMSLYCVGNTTHAKQAFRPMDLDTLNVIGQTTTVTDQRNGVWWTLRYNRSVRIRVINMQGLHISAVTFTTSSTSLAEEQPPMTLMDRYRRG